MKVFTYGSLLFPEVWQMISGQLHFSMPARLAGYCRRRIQGAPYPGIVPSPVEWVDGMLWHDVDQSALARLDDFEGEAYFRQKVEVLCCEELEVAYAYVVKPEFSHLLLVDDWNEEEFRQEDLPLYLVGCRTFSLEFQR